MTLPPLPGGSQRLSRAALLPLPAGRSVVLVAMGSQRRPLYPLLSTDNVGSFS